MELQVSLIFRYMHEVFVESYTFLVENLRAFQTLYRY